MFLSIEQNFLHLKDHAEFADGNAPVVVPIEGNSPSAEDEGPGNPRNVPEVQRSEKLELILKSFLLLHKCMSCTFEIQIFWKIVFRWVMRLWYASYIFGVNEFICGLPRDECVVFRVS